MFLVGLCIVPMHVGGCKVKGQRSRSRKDAKIPKYANVQIPGAGTPSVPRTADFLVCPEEARHRRTVVSLSDSF